ncbi:HlyD family secretion protein [Roseibium alexandrii]|uniref:Inner membrane protein YiaV n=1 Tax=Roseibium alexandrii TaxID=388408 RepID=A0A0M7AQJ3_9HYPH|nr:biotin/lipoyl-binding protein [Roseibium alexandrii]CTQ76686.1 Inner membrane protein YiaV precursor [Roseibium alexandrii]
MLEFLLCSVFTILPDYLYRRYVQGKRWGKELTTFSIWYELRLGITTCLILTVGLLTAIFYYHPTTTNVTSFFRTVTILPEKSGRVVEVLVENNQHVDEGDVLFRLDSQLQKVAVEEAQRKLAELEAQISVSAEDLAAAEGLVQTAAGQLEEIRDQLARKRVISERNSTVVSEAEIERLENLLASRQGKLAAAMSNMRAVKARIEILLPAQLASAEVSLERSEVELDKTNIRAGISGIVEQFALQPGDFVSGVLRPAGILVPDGSGVEEFQAGFNQITAQVIKPDMLAEITCFSKPFAIIPMRVKEVQNVLASGQFRPTDQLVDPQDRPRPGTLTVIMEPLYPGQAKDIPPGSKCIANAYTNNHDLIASGELGTGEFLFYHAVDAVGIVHALILRIQALMFPIQTLVLTGH